MPTTSATRSAPWRAIAGRARRRGSLVGDKALPGQAVVAALVFGEFRRQRLFLEPIDAPDRAGQRHAREIVGLEAAAIAAQGSSVRGAAMAERRSRGEGGEGEGLYESARVVGSGEAAEV